MYLIHILLQLNDNEGRPHGRELFRAVADELTEKFGGLTAHTRAPAEGLWKDGPSGKSKDEIVIYEVEALYREAWGLLRPGGVICNLEHVASPSARTHQRLLNALGITPDQEDRSNQLLDVETQLRWLREIGFEDVDCYWKWRELALLVGTRPKG
jgi:hypothetical protein